MKGFHKVIVFKMWNTYANVRAIADDIIESMNTHIKAEDAVTYSSTIKESFLCALGNLFDPVDEDEEDSSCTDEYSYWVIRIYRCDGNRGSRLARPSHNNVDNVSQKSTKLKGSFTADYMEMYRLNSALKFAIDKYKSMREFSDEQSIELVGMQCTDKMNKLINYIELLDKTYPAEMKQKEVEVNDVLRHIADCLNLLESEK